MKTHDGKIARKEHYTAGEVAWLFGLAHRTACKMVDKGEIVGFKIPGSTRRLVLLTELQRFVAGNPKFQYVLDKIEPLES